MNELENYIAERTYPHGSVTMQSLLESFRRTLTVKQQKVWPRRRVVAELKRLGYAVGRRGDKRIGVGGLSLDPPARWQVCGGRLVFA